MKKLLSFFTAGAVLLGSLGLFSCSGDLHDNEVQPLTVTGIAGTEVVPLTLDTPDGSEQSLTFKIAEDTEFVGMDGKKKLSLKDGWGGLSNIQLKIVPSTALKDDNTPDWSVDYGGEKDIDMYLSAATADYTTLTCRADLSSGYPSNIFLDGVVANETYTLKVKYDSAKEAVSVKLEGVVSNPSEVRFAFADDYKTFPKYVKDEKGEDVKDDDGNKTAASYAFEKAGTEYTYQFIAVANETVKFHLENDFGGGIVWQVASISDTASDLEINPATVTDFDFALKKDYEYKLTVDLKKVDAPTIKGEVVSLLKKASITGNWKYADAFYEADDNDETVKKGYLQFIAENTDFEFIVNRKKTDYTMIWGGATIAADGDAKALTYSATEKYAKNKPESIDDVKSKVAKITGLKAGTCYKLVLTEDADNFTLNANVITVPLTDLSMADVIGDIDGNGIKLGTADADGNYSVEIKYLNTMNEWGGSNGTANFKIRAVAGSWKDGDYGYSSIVADTLADGVTYGDGGGNAQLKGLKNEVTYIFKFIPDYGSIKLQVTEKK